MMSDRADIISQNFSEASQSYQAHAVAQSAIFDSLLMLIKAQEKGDIKTLLDLGCGSGENTVRLSRQFPKAKILGLDPAVGMIHAAKSLGEDNIQWKRGDLSQLDQGYAYDVVVSNTALHWSKTISEDFSKLKSLIGTRGRAYISVIGPESYQELKEALQAVFSQNISLPSDSFKPLSEYELLLERFFKRYTIGRESIEVSFPDFMSLLTHIRRTGTRGSGPTPPLEWTRKRIKDINNYFVEHYGRVVVSYHCYYLSIQGNE